MSLLVKMDVWKCNSELSIGVPFGAFAAGEKQGDVIKQLLE